MSDNKASAYCNSVNRNHFGIYSRDFGTFDITVCPGNSKAQLLVSTKSLFRKMKYLLKQSHKLANSQHLYLDDVRVLDDLVKNVVRSMCVKMKSSQHILMMNGELSEQREILMKTLKIFCEESIRSSEISKGLTNRLQNSVEKAIEENRQKDGLESHVFHKEENDLELFKNLKSEVSNLREDLEKISKSQTLNSTAPSLWQTICNSWKRDKIKRSDMNTSTMPSTEISDITKRLVKHGASTPDEVNLMNLIDVSVQEEITELKKKNLESEEFVHELLDEIGKQEQIIQVKDVELNEAREHIDVLLKRSKNDLATNGELSQQKRHDQDCCKLQEDKSMMSLELERLRQTNRRLLNEVCCLRHSNRELEQLIEKGQDQRLTTETHNEHVRGTQLHGFYGSGHFTPGLYLRNQITNASSPALVTTGRHVIPSSQFSQSMFDDVTCLSSNNDEAK
ncbi:uncharacterized protein [Antedon mediterranea]|uniref:uncharacterized protein isoform X2 n=1 Tax=Antedon mediterranea TaxID=105859 RepID=UPI003AF6198C